MTRALLLALLSLSTFAQPAAPPAKPAPKPKPWLEMDYGPVLSASIESARPTRNVTQKGIAIRLDAKGPAYVLFDADLMRYSAAWTGGPIDWKGVLFDGTHRTWASLAGDVVCGTSLIPGWAKGGSFDDPRPRFASTDYTKESKEWQNRPYGPLPREHAQYKGFYLHGQQVVLSYTVGGVAVLDSPGLEGAGSSAMFTRTLNIAKSTNDLDLEVLEQGGKSASILAGPRVPAAQRRATAQGSVAVVGDLTARPTTQPSLQPLAVVAKGASNDVEFVLAGETHLRLHIPAAATPAKIKLLVTRVHAGSLPAFQAAAEASAAPGDLSALTRGGPARYPETLTTKGALAPASDKPYLIDTLTAPNDNPFKARMRFGGFDFFPDGKSAAVCTWDGDVWLVSGIDDTLANLKWRRIATGLHQPLGLKIVPRADSHGQRTTDNGQIYVSCRDQIARLHDLNGDGEIDFYECFNCDHQVTEHFHEFAMGLQTDAAGNFYYAKSARHALDAVVPQHGTLIKVSKDGTKTEIVASGFRAANGVGVGPNGELATSDQEGFWTPANRINLMLPGAGAPFFGNIWSYASPKRTAEQGYDPPLCWMPTTVDRSPAEQFWVTSDRWGLLKGAMVHTSYGTGKLYLVLPQIVDGVPQGGLLPIPDLAVRTGIMRARFNPADGQLYACGLVGWATNMTEPGGFHRIRYTGKPVRLPVALHVRKGAIELTFTDALDKAAAEDVANYSIQQWDYRWTQNYGSKHFSVADPKKQGQDDVEVSAAALSADGKTVTLSVADLKPVMQMKIQLNLKSADGAPVKHTIHNTINKVPERK